METFCAVCDTGDGTLSAQRWTQPYRRRRCQKEVYPPSSVSLCRRVRQQRAGETDIQAAFTCTGHAYSAGPPPRRAETAATKSLQGVCSAIDTDRLVAIINVDRGGRSDTGCRLVSCHGSVSLSPRRQDMQRQRGKPSAHGRIAPEPRPDQTRVCHPKSGTRKQPRGFLQKQGNTFRHVYRL